MATRASVRNGRRPPNRHVPKVDFCAPKQNRTHRYDADESENDAELERSDEKARREFLAVASKRCALLTGEPTQNVAAWFDDFEHVAKWAQQSDTAKVWVLTSLIAGPALRVFKSMESLQFTFLDLRNAMFLAFVKNSRPDYARLEYEQCQQDIGESVRKFYNRLAQMAELAYPAVSRECLETDLAYRFLHGLRPDIAGLLSAVGPEDNMRARLAQAQRIEASHERYKKSPTFDPAVNVATAISPSELDRLTKQLEELRLKVDVPKMPLAQAATAAPVVQQPKKQQKPKRQKGTDDESERGNQFMAMTQGTVAAQDQQMWIPNPCYVAASQGYNQSGQPGHFFYKNPPQYAHGPAQSTQVPGAYDQQRVQQQQAQPNQVAPQFSSQQNDNRKNQNRANLTCFFCNRRGHIKSECNKYLKEMAIMEQQLRAKIMTEMGFAQAPLNQSQQAATTPTQPKAQQNAPSASSLGFIQGENASGGTFLTAGIYSSGHGQIDKPAVNGIHLKETDETWVQVSDNAHMRELKDDERQLFQFPVYAPVRIAAKLNNVSIRPLCDSGAQVSAITHTLIEDAFHYYHPKVNTGLQLYSANDETLSVYGSLQFYLHIGERKFPVEAYVVETLSDHLILGSNFLGHPVVRAVLDIYCQTITVGGEEFPLISGTVGEKTPGVSQKRVNVCRVQKQRTGRFDSQPEKPQKEYFLQVRVKQNFSDRRSMQKSTVVVLATELQLQLWRSITQLGGVRQKEQNIQYAVIALIASPQNSTKTILMELIKYELFLQKLVYRCGAVPSEVTSYMCERCQKCSKVTTLESTTLRSQNILETQASSEQVRNVYCNIRSLVEKVDVLYRDEEKTKVGPDMFASRADSNIVVMNAKRVLQTFFAWLQYVKEVFTAAPRS